MPVFVGIDLTAVEPVRDAVRAHGDRYLRRVYTDGERAECGRHPGRLALRFAAKEATMKAIGRRDEPLPWRSIEVRTGPGRVAEVVLHGAARRLARRSGVGALSISLSRTRSSACAVVLGEAAR